MKGNINQPIKTTEIKEIVIYKILQHNHCFFFFGFHYRARTMKPFKHKLPSCEAERGTRTKRAPLCGNAKLTEAVDKDDIAAITEILGSEDLRISRLCFHSALLKAAQDGKKRIIQLLLNHGVAVSGRGSTGSLALIAAAEHGYLDIVKLLIERGAPVNGQDSDGKTALMIAVEKSCCCALIKYLYSECRADVNLQDKAGKTVLMLAVELWDYETVQLLLLCDSNVNCVPCDVDIKDRDGLTAVDLAQRNGFSDLLNVLRHSHKKKISPLGLAAVSNNITLVRQLLEIHPACVHGIGGDQLPLATAMHGTRAKWDGKIHCNLEVMDLLLEANVNVNGCHSSNYTPLMMAAGAGSEPAVEKLLRHGADVNKCGLRQQTALLVAAYKGHANVMDRLVQAGADVNVRDENGKSVMDLVLKRSNRKCLQVLLKSRDTLNQEDIRLLEEHQLLDVLLEIKDCWSCLLKDPQVLHRVFCNAIQCRSYQLVETLIDFGAVINVCSVDNESSCPLFLSLDDIPMLRLLVDRGADVNIRALPHGHTALMQAALKGNVGLVNTFIDYNADMSIESNGLTALLLASSPRKLGVVRALLAGGVNVNHVTQTGETGLLFAVGAKDLALTEMFISRGANVNYAKTDGTTVLMHAINSECSSSIVQLLLTNQAAVNAQDANGDTALLHALGTSKKKVISLLLQNGAELNHTNVYQETPLIVAAKYCKASVLKILLERGASVNNQDRHGDTALHLAVRNYQYASFKVLVENGADWRLTNSEFRTPLMLGFELCDDFAVEDLLKFGAQVNVPSSPSVRLVWLSDLDSKLKKFSVYNNTSKDREEFINCLESLLKAGLSLDGVQETSLSLFISSCIFDFYDETIVILLQSGAGPNLLNLSHVPEDFPMEYAMVGGTVSYRDHSYISPLMFAIMAWRPPSIALFVQAGFFHETDVKMLQDPKVTKEVKGVLQNCNKYPSLIDELCPGNWSLQTWSKLAVMRAVGFGPGREHRVRALPIPVALQEELLFKHLENIELEDMVDDSDSDRNSDEDD